MITHLLGMTPKQEFGELAKAGYLQTDWRKISTQSLSSLLSYFNQNLLHYRDMSNNVAFHKNQMIMVSESTIEKERGNRMSCKAFPQPLTESLLLIFTCVYWLWVPPYLSTEVLEDWLTHGRMRPSTTPGHHPYLDLF